MAILGRVVIYAKDVDALVQFYSDLFQFEVMHDPEDRIVELRHPKGGARICIYPAAKSQKMGQVLVKLSFDIENVEAFAAQHKQFGPVHFAGGYCYSNGKDPAGNSIQVSSRAYRPD